MIIVNGKLTVRHLKELINKIREKMSGWKMRLLSAGGKLILLKHDLSSMPICLLLVLHVPKSVLIVINRILSTFFVVKRMDTLKRSSVLGIKLVSLFIKGD